MIGGNATQDAWYGFPRVGGFIRGLQAFCAPIHESMTWIQTVDQYPLNYQQMLTLFRSDQRITLIYGEDQEIIRQVVKAATVVRGGTDGLTLVTSTEACCRATRMICGGRASFLCIPLRSASRRNME